MERLVELYRFSSSAWAVASLVIANLVPLVGVLFFGWDLWTIIALYWAENGIIGLYTVAKILRAEGTSPVVASLSRRGLSGGQAGTLRAASRVATALFFVVHYGLFWFVHGIFVLVALPSFAGIRGDDGGPGPGFDPGVEPGFDPRFGDPGGDLLGVRADLDLVILGAAALAISHGVAFVFDFLGRKEYLRVSPQAQAGAPYGRLVTLHLTIILGAFLSAALGAPIGALLVLVALKTALDLALHLREHRALASPSGGGPAGPVSPAAPASPTDGPPRSEPPVARSP